MRKKEQKEMKKRIMDVEYYGIMAILIILCLTIFEVLELSKIDVSGVETVTPILHVENIPEVEIQTEVVEKIVTVEVPPSAETELDEADKKLIARVVHSEAGNQDMIGKRLVADVILNRQDSLSFPNTISGVIEQDNQFSCGAGFDPEDMEAVELELQSRLDHNVLWFRTGAYHNIGSRLYQHGAHYFSGR